MPDGAQRAALHMPEAPAGQLQPTEHHSEPESVKDEREAENAQLKDRIKELEAENARLVDMASSPPDKTPPRVLQARELEAAVLGTPAKKAVLQNVLRSVKVLVVAFDQNGCVTMVNHSESIERYFGVAESTIWRQKFSSWLADYLVLVQHIERCMNSEEEMEGWCRTENGEGETFEMSYTVSPLTFDVKGGDRSEAKPASTASLAAVGGVVGDAMTPRRRRGSEDRDSRKPQPSAQVRGCVVVFDDMTESKLMKATLGRYLNPALVELQLKSGSGTLGGVRQKVTILFSDIRSFTSISERMDASDLVAMLNEYFTYELDPIFENGGILDKFIGDAIMACFGVPLVSTDDGKTDACMSCKCALEQLAALEVFNQRRREERGPDTETFAIGIGLNTNQVVSGNIGSKKRMEYTVIGDGVNLASRLEGITKTYGVKVCMSEFTNQEVTSHFITREIDTVAVKGKEDGIKIFELIAAREDCSWDSLAFRTEAAKEHPTFLTRVSQLPQAKALEPFLGRFDVALNNYRTHKFDEAIAGFQEIADAVQDPVSKLFIGRCNEFKVDPPEANWDGVYRPKSK